MTVIAEAVQPLNSVLDLQIAGMTWRLENHCAELRMLIDSRTSEFLVHSEETPDALITVCWGTDFKASKDVIFDAGLWRAYAGDEYVFDFQSPTVGPTAYKRAIFNRDFTRGQVLLNRMLLRGRDSYYPFEYPLDELAMMHRLSLGHGVELHCCGLVADDGRGYLFVGHSGAGKSTMGKLWVSECQAQILSDDRVIVTLQEDRFFIHGTPWHGEAGLASNGRAELKAIYLIQHGKRNELLGISPTRASAELFSRSFVPWYRPESLEFALSFVQSIASRVPVSVLRFVPDSQVITFLEESFAI